MDSMIPVFIASPSDVRSLREVVKDNVNKLAPRLATIFKKTIVPIMWEWMAPIAPHNFKHPQYELLQYIQPFSIVVGIFGEKYGENIEELGLSGSEVELNRALEQRNTSQVLIYFKKYKGKKNSHKSKTNQQKRLNEFKERLKKKNAWFSEFTTDDEFKSRIDIDLMEAAVKLILVHDPTRIQNYREFFQFGLNIHLGLKSLLIVYPSLTDSGPGHQAPKINWQNYLSPHIVYEDAKIIQDLEEVMRLLSREYTTITTESPDIEMADPGDRVWVCIPRNHRAQEMLKIIGDSRVRFSFEENQRDINERECILKWKSDYSVQSHKHRKMLTIPSPLSKYLKYSKRRPEGENEWDPTYGFTFVRDYAVIAKYRIEMEPGALEREYYYNYFIGGIRGLGTWGAGHLIDHDSSKLIDMAKKQKGVESVNKNDVQILVEVTYEDYKIIDVKNVSNNSKDYFEERYSDDFIKSELKAKKLLR